MISWGVTITCENTGQFSSAKGSLHLKQATLLRGKKAYLKVRIFKNNKSEEFVLGVLTQEQPNLILRHEFRESVDFLIEGTTNPSLSLFGSLHTSEELLECSDLNTLGIENSLNCVMGMASIFESVLNGYESNVSNEMSDRVVDVTDEIGLETDNKSDNLMLKSNTIEPNDNLEEKKNCLDSCEMNKTRTENKKASKTLEGTETTSNMKKKKAHEPTTVSVLKKESNETIEKPLKQRTLPGGITYSILSIGEGKIATVGKHVRVKYEGRLASTGKKFDHGTLDFTIGAGEMIKGFDIGIRGMLVKEKRRIFLPSRMAYGKERVGSIPPNSNLIFEITLLSVS